MSGVATFVRFIRTVSDPLAVFSFTRLGFELNRRGFDPADVPRNVAKRVALVTGANSGIGRATSLELARRGFDVWMLCRDSARGAEARDAIARECGGERVHLCIVDVSNLGSIRRFAAELPLNRIDVLVHNAGVLPDQKRLTDDGVELTFATNVVGPFALTRLLLDRLSRSNDARVIFVASGGLYLQRLDLSLPDVVPARFDGTRAYANAKRAQVILARVLADTLPRGTSITFASMHPGWVDTTALQTALPRFHAAMKRVLRTPEQGADTVVWLATSDAPKRTSGQFWFDRRVAVEHPFPWTRESLASRTQLLGLCENISGLAIVEKSNVEAA